MSYPEPPIRGSYSLLVRYKVYGGLFFLLLIGFLYFAPVICSRQLTDQRIFKQIELDDLTESNAIAMYRRIERRS